jgi:hypothetical protein
MKVAVLAICALGVFGSTAHAQQQQQQGCPAPRSMGALPDSVKPDIAVIARVQAAEVRFNSQPGTSLQLFGCPQIDTSKVVLRTNLPTPVQPGVTYRNVVVDFRLNMKFAELECVLAGRPCVARPDSVRRDTTRIR